jgi:hypothetical protein
MDLITRADEIAWAGRALPDEKPPPVDTAVLREIRKANCCSWCFAPIDDQSVEFNGGRGHPECAQYVRAAVVGEDGDPTPPWVTSKRPADPLTPFCRRLGREAARLGIDKQKLGLAIGRARCA